MQSSVLSKRHRCPGDQNDRQNRARKCRSPYDSQHLFAEFLLCCLADQHDAPGHRLDGTSHFFSELQADPSLAIDFIIAPPRMAYYMEYSTRIYQVYLKYIAPEDIVV